MIEVDSFKEFRENYSGRELAWVLIEDLPEATEPDSGLYWTLDTMSNEGYQKLKQVLHIAQHGDYFLIDPGSTGLDVIWAYSIECCLELRGRRVFLLTEYRFDSLSYRSSGMASDPYYVIDENLTLLEPIEDLEAIEDYEEKVERIADEVPRCAPSSAYRKMKELHEGMKLFI